MEQVFLSLGSNIGDRLGNLRGAIAALRTFARVTALSHAYETEPVEYTAQPWFANAAVALEWDDEPANDTAAEQDRPRQLLERLMAIERELGRRREGADYISKGPRVIDLDIVLYGSRVIRTATLTVPHPAMHERRFVLEPLAEIAPQVVHPVLHKTVLELLRALPPEGAQVRELASLDGEG